MNLEWSEIILVAFVALLVYGGRLPEVARSVGRSFAALKRGLRDSTDGIKRDLDPGLDDVLQDPPRRTVRAPAAPPDPSPIDRPAPPELATEDVSSPENPGRG